MISENLLTLSPAEAALKHNRVTSTKCKQTTAFALDLIECDNLEIFRKLSNRPANILLHRGPNEDNLYPLSLWGYLPDKDNKKDIWVSVVATGRFVLRHRGNYLQLRLKLGTLPPVPWSTLVFKHRAQPVAINALYIKGSELAHPDKALVDAKRRAFSNLMRKLKQRTVVARCQEATEAYSKLRAKKMTELGLSPFGGPSS